MSEISKQERDYNHKSDFQHLAGGELRFLIEEKFSVAGMHVRLSSAEIALLKKAAEWFEYEYEKRQKRAIKAGQTAGRKITDNSPEAAKNRERVRRFREKNKKSGK